MLIGEQNGRYALALETVSRFPRRVCLSLII